MIVLSMKWYYNGVINNVSGIEAKILLFLCVMYGKSHNEITEKL